MHAIILAGVVAGCLVGCGAQPSPKPPQPAPAAVARPAGAEASPAAPAGKPTKPAFPGTPASPAGDQLAWVLDAIVTRHGKLERAELESHFEPKFLAEVPPDKALALFAQLAPSLAGLAIAELQTGDDWLIAHATAGSARLRISLAIDAQSRKISGLFIQPDAEPAPKPASFDDALRMLAELAPRAQLLVAALDHGTCRPLQALAATDQLAIGSTFKLYVLLALADRVLAGKAAWTDELAVRDDWKSLPPGTTQNELPGKKDTLAVLAERMISVSDNTAADHLLYTLGRRDVEAAVRATRHARPALDAPFLATRELFVMKLGTPADEVERYLKLPEARRRDYLDKTLASKDPNAGIAVEWKTARWVDKLEWFASSEDLCGAMAALWSRAQKPQAARLLDVLAKNPGLPIDKHVFPYVGYKGGSEPGVFNMTFLLRRDDGKWFVVTLGANAAEGGALEDGKILAIAAGVIELLGAAR